MPTKFIIALLQIKIDALPIGTVFTLSDLFCMPVWNNIDLTTRLSFGTWFKGEVKAGTIVNCKDLKRMTPSGQHQYEKI